MKERYPIPTYFIVVFIIGGLISAAGTSKSHSIFTTYLPFRPNTHTSVLPKAFADKLHSDTESIHLASTDYGNIVRDPPAAVLRPSSLDDIVSLIKSSYDSSAPVTIAARGRSHSVRGQATARGGVVIDMMSLRDHAIKSNGDGRARVTVASVYDTDSGKHHHYADVGGETLWIDVLWATTERGFAPVSWTDYLYLTVGGTLSNAGISGQTFRYGPQISNVLELDVITGAGELFTCSPSNNSELFYAVLGGLGQFGIITRARIAVEPAPKRVKWVRMLYSDFSAFTRDQERLISINGRNQPNALDYLEGQLLMGQGSLNNWRSSFFPESHLARITSLVTKHGIIYCLEVAKYYHDLSRDSVNEDLEDLFEGSEHIPGFMFEKDVSAEEFLNRVRPGEVKLQAQGLWDVPHPWLNLFVPKSRISDFDDGVFKSIVLRSNITTGIVLVYPMNRNKWDDRMSASVPDEEVFYAVGFLQSSGFDDWQRFDRQNEQVLQYCKDAGISIKQYLPHYRSKEDWARHFGSKWRTFHGRKTRFDPKMILSPGQRIFN